MLHAKNDDFPLDNFFVFIVDYYIDFPFQFD